MGKEKSHYQTLLNDLSDWVIKSAKQDMLTIYEIIDQGKAYLHAAEDLSLEEIRTLENYLLRDVKAAMQHLREDADNSLWWANTKDNLWQLIASMSDRNKLEYFEMQEDVSHQGIYQVGELVAIGELICIECGHKHQVSGVQRIQPCVECSGQAFSRRA
ncbi:MAG: hypothetical protein ACI808_003256 [Paraglaciecola sp.]|jgi:hypothetical protein